MEYYLPKETGFAQNDTAGIILEKIIDGKQFGKILNQSLTSFLYVFSI
jgi:hypothetical protein